MEQAIDLSYLRQVSCGDCSLCCKLFKIDELDKAEDMWCGDCKPGKGGCTRYETRPTACREFECFWLQSQRHDQSLPADVRPDKSHVILTASTVMKRGEQEQTLLAHVDPDYPDAWQKGTVGVLLTRIIASGAKVAIRTGTKRMGFVNGRGIEWTDPGPGAAKGEEPADPAPPGVTGSSEPAPSRE